MARYLSPTVTIADCQCRIEFGKYNNNTLAMQAICLDDEPFAVLTVNWEQNWQGCVKYRKAFPFPAVVIKNYSENEGFLADLEREGVVERGGCYMSGSDRGVEVRMLTPKWQEVCRNQGYK